MKLAYKLTSIFLVFTASITFLFFLITRDNQERVFRQVAIDHMGSVEAAFHNLQERDTQLLTSTLDAITRDTRLRELYLRKNKDELYRYAWPLYRSLKEKHGITHFYFILPDARVFLRVHEQEIFGDRVRRKSFQQARETGLPASEMELGKTAFALRVVMPYYDRGTLIGYLELGEEINHFLRILKEQTRSDFGLFADKNNLERNDWLSMKLVAGLGDDWGQLGKHVIISSTRSGEIADQCFRDENLELTEAGEQGFRQFTVRDQTFLCSGMAFNDARGKHIGALLSLLDVSDHAALAAKTNKTTIIAALLLFMITGAAGVVLSRTLSRPIEDLTRIAREVGRGNLTQTIEAGSNDEIGQLARSFKLMVEQRKQAEDALLQSEEKYRSLVESTEDSIYVVDRSCNYIYMNMIHRRRLGLRGIKYAGTSYAAYHTAAQTAQFCEEVDKVLAQGASFLHEHVNVRDGRYYLHTLSPIKDARGTVTAITVISKDITDQKSAEVKLREERDKLQQALDDVKQLSGLLPICAQCKKIRDDEGYWTQIEAYLHSRTNAQFTHGICPDCAKKLFSELDDLLKE